MREVLDNFYSFDPSQNIFNTITSSIPFAKLEFSFEALKDGLYVVSNVGDVFRYDTSSDTWSSTTVTSLQGFIDAFRTTSIDSRDPNAPAVSASESRTINASNNSLYFSYEYGLDAFGKFDVDTVSFQKLSLRPSHQSDTESSVQWDMAKF